MNDDAVERLEQGLRHLRSQLQRALEDKAVAEERLTYAEQLILELRAKLAARGHQVSVGGAEAEAAQQARPASA